MTEVPHTHAPRAGAVDGVPRLLLRLEGAALALVAILAYVRLGAPWWLFAVFILAPDLSMLGYLAGTRTGAIVYNAFHVTLGPLVLALLGFLLPQFDVLAIALTWLCHIGIDRAFGFGLKYKVGFAFSHLGRVGRVMAS
jgi:uncharacterized protein DUF4260